MNSQASKLYRSSAPSRRRLPTLLFPAAFLLLSSHCGAPAADDPPPPFVISLDELKGGLTESVRVDYLGEGDGGLSHTTYYSIVSGSAEYQALPKTEQAKLAKLQSSILHSAKLTPTVQVAGTEITGTLSVQDGAHVRVQEIVLKVPKNWNGSLVVAGTPGTRSELASDAVLAAWLVQKGYAYVAGNKGMTNGGADGNATLLGKNHITASWGMMMHDLALWASTRLQAALGKAPAYTYAVGLSNGGYQVRRALELDEERVSQGQSRRFAGGLDWAGVYFPGAVVLDANRDGKVSPAEYAAAVHLVSSNERAALAMGYLYDPGTVSTPAGYGTNPPFAGAEAAMGKAGFGSPSSILWGTYNIMFDVLKAKFPAWKGVGYYNLTAYYFRADLMGHDAKESAAYSMFSSGSGHPPLYDYLATEKDAGWTDESVSYALRNANSGTFSVPLVSLHGDKDALIGLPGHGIAYAKAVETSGNAALHRLYVVQHGNHVDAHADGTLDYDCNGIPGDEGAKDKLTPMQPYVERAFSYLIDWVEHSRPAPASKTIATDPKSDILDANQINF